MSDRITVQIDGLPELIRAVMSNERLADEMRGTLADIGMELESDAKRLAPSNFGKLRSSITHKVDSAPLPTFVKVGVIGGRAATYATYMEFGTGQMSDHPSWPKSDHRVHSDMLLRWAESKLRGEIKGKRDRRQAARSLAYLAARSINERGGLAPRRYLRQPFEDSRLKYTRMLVNAVRRGIRLG